MGKRVMVEEKLVAIGGEGGGGGHVSVGRGTTQRVWNNDRSGV